MKKYIYVLITKLNSLLGKQGDTRLFCPYCCHGFVKRYAKDGKMEEHMENCFKYGGCKVIMPDDGKNIIEFREIDKQMMAPYTIYCDCEAIIKNIDEKNIHEISGFNISVVSPYEETQ